MLFFACFYQLGARLGPAPKEIGWFFASTQTTKVYCKVAGRESSNQPNFIMHTTAFVNPETTAKWIGCIDMGRYQRTVSEKLQFFQKSSKIRKLWLQGHAHLPGQNNYGMSVQYGQVFAYCLMDWLSMKCANNRSRQSGNTCPMPNHGSPWLIPIP